MVRRKKSHKLVYLCIFLVIAILVSGGILLKLWLDTDPFFKPGTLTYGSSLTEDERNLLNEKYTSVLGEKYKLHGDVTFSVEVIDEYKASDDSIITTVYVPTVDFYSQEINLTAAEAETKATWTELDKLTQEKRVVSIDNKYYFDDPTKTAKFRIIKITAAESGTIPDMKKVLDESFSDVKIPTKKEDFLSFAQTGVTALTRAMTNTLNGAAKGRGSYFADKIKDFLNKNDLVHISNEVSFYDGCKGGSNTMSLCADWRSLDSITAIGTNIVELTGNHNNNYGYKANTNTINKYHSLGMKTFGGGLNETEAKKPLELSEKGNNITLLGYNKSTSTKGNGELANGDKPGANGYDEATAKKQIADAKARGDIVIVDIQYAECWSYPDGYVEMPACDKPINGQQALFRRMIDFGADMVIGTQAHHPQTFEIYKGKPIYYGLGNLFFDQTYWPGTQRGYILTHYFYNGKILNTRISPTWYEKAHQVYLTNEKTSESFINRLVSASPKGK